MPNDTLAIEDKEALEARAWHLLEMARDAVEKLPQAARTYQLTRIQATIEEFAKQDYERRLRLMTKHPAPRFADASARGRPRKAAPQA